jgi:hypothetical protein
MPLRPLKKLTFLSAAGYLLMFALCAKAVSLFASQHPSKDNLLAVRGTVTDVRLGGPGEATWLIVASEGASVAIPPGLGGTVRGWKRSVRGMRWRCWRNESG